MSNLLKWAKTHPLFFDGINISLFGLILLSNFFLAKSLQFTSVLFLSFSLMTVACLWLWSRLSTWLWDYRLPYALIVFAIADYLSVIFSGPYIFIKTFTHSKIAAAAGTFLILSLFIVLVRWLLGKIEREKFSVIVFTFFSVTLISLGIKAFPAPGKIVETPKYANLSESKGNIYYFFLDGHIGTEGIPAQIPGGAELKQMLKERYSQEGFQLFGGAYSNYYTTNLSLSSILNGSRYKPSYVTPSSEGNLLEQASLLEKIISSGYSPVFHQSHFINVCHALSLPKSECHLGEIHGLSILDQKQIPLPTKWMMVLASLLDSYIRPDSLILRVYFYTLYESINPKKIWPLSGLETLENLKSELPRYRANTFVFTSVLLPHWPYSFDASCHLKKARHWRQETDKYGFNNATSYHETYASYFEVVYCIHQQLAEIFDILKTEGLYEKATIIIHSDHGSRIALRPPKSPIRESFQEQDFWDNYSTFFAIKAGDFPQLPSPFKSNSYDSTVTPVALLMAKMFVLPVKDDLRPIFLFGETVPMPLGVIPMKR